MSADTEIVDAAQARTLGPDEYYAKLVERNHGLVPAPVQRRIQGATLLVAGCGSIGGAAVQPLARMGYTRFRFADNGVYELNNLNRQHALLCDLGRNKATVAGRYVRDINPYAEVTVGTDGVTAANAEQLVTGVDVIVDGVDVTTAAGLAAKVALHTAARAQRKPLITGWDMAGTLAVQYLDYRRLRRIFDGELTAADVHRLSVWEAVFRIAPRRHIPAEMYDQLAGSLSEPGYSVPQLVEAATQFGSLAAHLVTKIVADQPVPRTVVVDVRQVSSNRTGRLADQLRRPLAAARFLRSLPPAAAWNGFTPRPLYDTGRRLTRGRPHREGRTG